MSELGVLVEKLSVENECRFTFPETPKLCSVHGKKKTKSNKLAVVKVESCLDVLTQPYGKYKQTSSVPLINNSNKLYNF
jgi:hypothetical protein